ncbi:adenylylsulfate kinase-like kinase [SAR116 cluster alpha proteobacterium HIMB100]|nr:adenylylsulfate kinase-like kinase [SAR116 cluster alpha proteobacterium HIMB100]
MKTLKILIFGLPGSGKTFLANKLAQKLGAEHLNADKIRENANDWDFSDLGRRRQVERMQNLANESNEQFVILDFVCPIEAHRVSLDVSISISMDTVSKSRYEDTNMLFERPKYFKPDYHIKEKNSDLYANQIVSHLIPFNWRKPTVQMLGRWQPFHDGHLELFKRALAKTGQVAIQVRNCQNWGNSNPTSSEYH